VKPPLYACTREHIVCPQCGKNHVDRGEWTQRAHHTHLCEHCGHVFDVKRYSFGIEPHEHAHTWTPVPTEVATYACACGAAGKRDGLNPGAIREFKSKRAKDYDRGPRVAVSEDGRQTGHGRVGRRGPGGW
jgi:hypothetical protein